MDKVVVVAAAIIDNGRLLSAQRAEPPRLRGGWELPGGKVEPGETEHEALVRECVEEIGARVVPGRRVGPELAVNETTVLRAYLATLVDEQPVCGLDHLDIRWLGPDQLWDVAWLPQNRELVKEIGALLDRG